MLKESYSVAQQFEILNSDPKQKNFDFKMTFELENTHVFWLKIITGLWLYMEIKSNVNAVVLGNHWLQQWLKHNSCVNTLLFKCSENRLDKTL